MRKAEIAIYLLVGCSSLFLVSYSVHMFVGGLIDPLLERNITIGVTIIWFFVLVFIGWDIAKRRRRN